MNMDSSVGGRLREALEEDFRLAWKRVNELERYAHWQPDEPDEEEELAEMQLVHAMSRIELRLTAAFETLGLRLLAERLAKQISSHKSRTSFQMLPWIGELWNPALGDLIAFYEVLKPYLPPGEADAEVPRERERLRSILAGTPKMLSDRQLDPKNEHDVEMAVYQTLIHIFPDTVRQIPIPKTVKTYKPDIGVRGLKTAIEYKFADTDTEFKDCLDGIFTDIHAYAGSQDWTEFVAVIYTTGAFFTQAQLEAHLQASSVPSNWHFIMVTGRGARLKRTKQSATKSPVPPKPARKQQRPNAAGKVSVGKSAKT